MVAEGSVKGGSDLADVCRLTMNCQETGLMEMTPCFGSRAPSGLPFRSKDRSSEKWRCELCYLVLCSLYFIVQEDHIVPLNI